MATNDVPQGVALLLLVGIIVELRVPLLSLLELFLSLVCRYGLDPLVEASLTYLKQRGYRANETSSKLPAEGADAKAHSQQGRVEREFGTISVSAVGDLPDAEDSPSPEDVPPLSHTPSIDDQSDTATVHGGDDSTADPQKSEGTPREEVDELPHKDEELWFEDGNLILATPTVQFRVYRGLLATQSLVFKDMLSLPQPPAPVAQSPPRCAACVPPITIPVTDSPSDLRHFLKALTGTGMISEGYHPTYDTISAVIRMAHKYQCETLLAGCMKYLSCYYHDDFTLWRNDEAVFSPPKFKRIHCVGVVNLARLVGADKWLPGALMGCCTLGAELIDGFVREDGTRETLSPADLGRCYLGRANLIEANASATLKLLKQTLSPDCARRERCEPVLRRLLSVLTDIEVNKKTLFSLRWDWSWTTFVDRYDAERNLCWACYRMLGKHSRQKDLHREIYERLPELMGVKVDKWGLPEPGSDAPQGDNDVAAVDPAAAQPPVPVLAPVFPGVVFPIVPPAPPVPIVIQPPMPAPAPGLQIIVVPGAPPNQVVPPPPAQPAVPVVAPPAAAPGP